MASLPRSIIRGVRPVPDGTTRNGPALVGPDSDAVATVDNPGTFAETGHEARPRGPLGPTDERMTSRPREMDAVARQAEAHVRHGYSLAARGALYSARAEFVLALRTITQALDLQSGNREHSQALAVGLGALEEAEDFIPLGSRLEADLDIGILVSAHRTPVLKKASGESLLPLVALQRYYTYAQEQLGRAAGHEEAGSMALYGLGKVYGTMADNGLPNVVAPEPKAMVFHQAAIETHPGNFMAANELAVLSARYGRYETARELLRHGASIAGYSAIWQNLAVVHRHLGETELAVLAQNEAALAAQRESAAAKAGKLVSSSDVRWVDADTFAGTSKPTTDLQRPAATPTGPVAAQPASVPPDTAVPTATRSWWPFSARNQSPAQPGPIRR
ncbi:MAG TPA: tetratricopeptide repeat protein [Pirellulales bacterium]|nr:tetratricopeptide repeat protein [Pirellulales bacterium]